MPAEEQYRHYMCRQKNNTGTIYAGRRTIPALYMAAEQYRHCIWWQPALYMAAEQYRHYIWWQPALYMAATGTIYSAHCHTAKRFHRHYSGQPALQRLPPGGWYPARSCSRICLQADAPREHKTLLIAYLAIARNTEQALLQKDIPKRVLRHVFCAPWIPVGYCLGPLLGVLCSAPWPARFFLCSRSILQVS